MVRWGVLLFLKYGWPLNRDLNAPVAQTWQNHASEVCYPQQVTSYIEKELKYKTLLGPFMTSPFPKEKTGVSPMSTRPKKNTEKGRVIVDLSWPIDGALVNSAIPKDEFMGSPINLRYPTIDMLCKRACGLGPGQVGWRKDMERAFLQIPLDPLMWCMMGIYWMGALFFNKSAVMGCRSAPYACQHTTNVIRHFTANLNYIVFNYIDDFMSIDSRQWAWKSYQVLAALLRDLGVHESLKKSVARCHVIEFLGIIFDLIRMIIILP